jgi:hypothetical protein
MNIFVLVEGENAAKQIYSSWIPFVNPSLSEVKLISEFSNNNFYVFAGYGYPYYLEAISAAITDINSNNNISRLVIAVDSEDMSYQEKYDEINNYLVTNPCRVDIKIIIQHFCFETWALGNKKINIRNIQNSRLREYKAFYDIYNNDPELLPPYPKEGLNRAHFAYKYLIRLLNEKNRNLSYSKNNAKALLHYKYFEQLKIRLDEKKHISSFKTFLEAFV